jgi:hypothetical protein
MEVVNGSGAAGISESPAERMECLETLQGGRIEDTLAPLKAYGLARATIFLFLNFLRLAGKGRELPSAGSRPAGRS